MIKLTQTELKWIMNMAESAQLNSMELAKEQNNQFKEIHNLHAANMACLYNKLARVIKNGNKRIEVTRG